MSKRSSTEQDTKQHTRSVLDQTPPNAEPKPEQPEKNPAAVALGWLGGIKGGEAKAKKLTAEQRSEIAKKAAAARWNKRANR